MIVTIGGMPGSGKSTVGKMLAERLGFRYISVGDIWGATAKELGLTLNEFHERLREDPSYEYKTEEMQKQIGEEQDNIVVESRLGFFSIPQALKVFLTVDADIGAERVFHTKRIDEIYSSVEETKKELARRIAFERERYKEIYHVDHYDTSHYDLVIDATEITPEEIVAEIEREV